MLGCFLRMVPTASVKRKNVRAKKGGVSTEGSIPIHNWNIALVSWSDHENKHKKEFGKFWSEFQKFLVREKGNFDKFEVSQKGVALANSLGYQERRFWGKNSVFCQ